MHFEIEEKFCVSYFSCKDCLRKLMGMCKCVIEEKNQRLYSLKWFGHVERLEKIACQRS